MHLVLAAAVLLCFPFSQVQLSAQSDQGFVPDVIVLILVDSRGDGQVSVNYSKELPTGQVENDVRAILSSGAWHGSDLEVNTRSTSAPGAVPTTSASFRAASMVDASSGLLPVAPFVNALKRLSNIEIHYLQVPEMSFQGPKDFENQFVKIKMSQSQGSFRYRVNVKDSGFDKLEIPTAQTEPAKDDRNAGSGARCAWVIAIAVAAAALAYVLTMLLSRTRRSRGA